jgi:hypothetical protein
VLDPLAAPLECLDNVVNTPGTSYDELYAASRGILAHAPVAPRESIDGALRHMAGIIGRVDALGGAIIAIVCGALVEEFGGSPDTAIESVLTCLLAALPLALTFARACERAYASSNLELDEDQSPIQRFGPELSETMPGEARGWASLEFLCPATVAMLSVSRNARRQARARSGLRDAVSELAPIHDWTSFVANILAVLDEEELVVLHPELRRGYRIQISGIADNFQLHTLLADALIGAPGAGWLPGERPDPRVVAAARDQEVAPSTPDVHGVFDQYNWQALQCDGSLPTGTRHAPHWIWNEGTPTDIACFEGTRIVLLGPPSYARAWSAGRRFMGMEGELKVLEVLTPGSVQDWLNRMTRSLYSDG